MNMTQTQLAAATEVSQAFISLLLSGKSRPSWRVAKRLSAATGTAPELWLEGTPEQIKAALDRSREAA